MHDDDIRRLREQRNGDKVFHRVERQLAIERGVHCEIGAAPQDRIAIRCRFRCEFGADVASGAATVIDDHLLAETFTQFGCKQTRRSIRASPRYEGHDQTNGLGGITLRVSIGAVQGRERAATRDAQYFHSEFHVAPRFVGRCAGTQRPQLQCDSPHTYCMIQEPNIL